MTKLTNSNETTVREVMKRLVDLETPGLLRIDNGMIVALPSALPRLLAEIERHGR